MEWLLGPDTGMSSMALLSCLMIAAVPNHRYPSDASDFGRCYRMLTELPELRANIPKATARMGPVWRRMGKAWDDLTSLYAQGREDEVYALLLKCRRER